MERGIRLSEKTIKAIKETAEEVFGKYVEVYIFGSRVDPSEKGGDIDLLIKAPLEKEEMERRKIKFLLSLWKKIGQQKVDVVLYSKGEEEKPIHKVALSEGVKL